MFQIATYIRDVYLYITNNMWKLRLGTRGGGGGGDVLQTKTRGGPAYNTWNTAENYINRQFFHKIIKCRILVVHDFTNDISYDAKPNRSKTCHFGGKILKILRVKKNREKLENICSIHICWYVG